MHVFSTIDDQEVIYPCLFTFKIFKQHVSITFQHALAFAIDKKIILAKQVCSRPPIIIKSHDLHACDIRMAMSEIVSYHEKD